MYIWVEDSLQKYGKEVTENLIKRQKEYEEEERDNDCKYCGRGNEGVVIEWEDGKPGLMHCGLWTEDKGCNFCGRPM